MGNAAPATKAVSRLVLLDGKFSSLPAALEQGRQVITNIEMVANLFLTKTGFAILLGVMFSLFGLTFPFLPRQYSTADFLIVGASSFALTLLPNSRRYVPGFLRRVLNYTVPNSIIVVAMLLAVTFTARGMGGSSVQPCSCSAVWCVAGSILCSAVRADSGGVPPVRCCASPPAVDRSGRRRSGCRAD